MQKCSRKKRLFIREGRNLKKIEQFVANRSTHFGRPKLVRILANINQVSKSVERSPKKSLRKRNQELGINIGSLRARLKKDVNLYPYKIQIKQVITDEEMKKRLQMAR